MPKASIDKPESLVRPANKKALQAVLDRAHQQEKAASKAALRVPGGGKGLGNGNGLLSKALGMALAHHGRTKKNGPSLRPTAKDTGGRAFHFSHSTVGKTKTKGSGGGGSAGGSTGGSAGSGSGGGQGGSQASPAGKGPQATRESAHQGYIERDAAVARDQAQDFDMGFTKSPSRTSNKAAEKDMGESLEPGRTKAKKVEINKAAVQEAIAAMMPGAKMHSAAAAQEYIEDPEKVPPQLRHGHSNSFGTIGATFAERAAFWDDVNNHEREKDARTQIRLVLELPHEATPAARQEIVRRFTEAYEDMGVPYWAAIHAPTKKNDSRNFHAHIVHGIRPARKMIDPTTGQEAWDFTITTTYKKKNRVTKTRHPYRQNVAAEFRDRNYPRESRARFADVVNQVMKKHGCPIRYDPRSYKDMGLDIEPQKHVSRVIADKLKSNDFVVMDAEWTRAMIEREMQIAAIDRDKTYRKLKKVEKSLLDLGKEVKNVQGVNKKLPKSMQLSPFSRLTTKAAQGITKRLLSAERDRLAQRFVDENTRRTLQHIIDATAPVSVHRDGKARKARPNLPPGMTPDVEAMTQLHVAAVEEMRLHKLQSASAATRAANRVAGILKEWRSEAEPTPPTGAAAATEASRPNPILNSLRKPAPATPGTQPTPRAPAPGIAASQPPTSDSQRPIIVPNQARPQAPAVDAGATKVWRLPIHPALRAVNEKMGAMVKGMIESAHGSPDALAAVARAFLARETGNAGPSQNAEPQPGAAATPQQQTPAPAHPASMDPEPTVKPPSAAIAPIAPPPLPPRAPAPLPPRPSVGRPVAPPPVPIIPVEQPTNLPPTPPAKKTSETPAPVPAARAPKPSTPDLFESRSEPTPAAPAETPTPAVPAASSTAAPVAPRAPIVPPPIQPASPAPVEPAPTPAPVATPSAPKVTAPEQAQPVATKPSPAAPPSAPARATTPIDDAISRATKKNEQPTQLDMGFGRPGEGPDVPIIRRKRPEKTKATPDPAIDKGHPSAEPTKDAAPPTADKQPEKAAEKDIAKKKRRRAHFVRKFDRDR